MQYRIPDEGTITSSTGETMTFTRVSPPEYSVVIKSQMGFRKRLWAVLTNPFVYLFKGEIRW